MGKNQKVFIALFFWGYFCFLTASEAQKIQEGEPQDFLLYTYLRSVEVAQLPKKGPKKSRTPQEDQLTYAGCFLGDFSTPISISLANCRSVENIEKIFILKVLALSQEKLKWSQNLKLKTSLHFQNTLFSAKELKNLNLEEKSVPLIGWILLDKKQESEEYGSFDGELNATDFLIDRNVYQIHFKWKGEYNLSSKCIEYLEFELNGQRAQGDASKAFGVAHPTKPVSYLEKDSFEISGEGKVQRIATDEKAPQHMIDNAISQGVSSLKQYLKENKNNYGAIALVLLACLKSDLVKEDDTLILQNIDKLLNEHQYAGTYIEYDTYTPGLILMLGEVFLRKVESLPRHQITPEMDTRIKKMQEKMKFTLECLISTYETKIKNGNAGWGGPDLSNTQYGILGLHSATRYGLFTPNHPKYKQIWDGILTLVLEGQQTSNNKAIINNIFVQKKKKSGESVVMAKVKVGGWPYRIGSYGKKIIKSEPNEGAQVSHSMTCTGIASVAIAMKYLENAKLLSALNRNVSQTAILQGLAWMKENYSVWNSYGIGTRNYFYYMYALERAGITADFSHIGNYDWYRDGAFALCVQQSSSGSWSSTFYSDEVPTSFAILFLKRASSPVITSGSRE